MASAAFGACVCKLWASGEKASTSRANVEKSGSCIYCDDLFSPRKVVVLQKYFFSKPNYIHCACFAPLSRRRKSGANHIPCAVFASLLRLPVFFSKKFQGGADQAHVAPCATSRLLRPRSRVGYTPHPRRRRRRRRRHRRLAFNPRNFMFLYFTQILTMVVVLMMALQKVPHVVLMMALQKVPLLMQFILLTFLLFE